MILNRTDYQEAKGRCSFANVCLPEGPIMALSLFLSLPASSYPLFGAPALCRLMEN